MENSLNASLICSVPCYILQQHITSIKMSFEYDESGIEEAESFAKSGILISWDYGDWTNVLGEPLA